MKKILGLSIAFLIVIVIAVFTIYIKVSAEKNDHLKMTDAVFQSNFSQLCNNLNKDESEEINQENEKYAYVCFSIFSLTSFSENKEMNEIVHILYDLSEKEQLYDELEQDVIDDLNRLSQDIHNDVLLTKIIASIGSS